MNRGHDRMKHRKLLRATRVTLVLVTGVWIARLLWHRSHADQPDITAAPKPRPAPSEPIPVEEPPPIAPPPVDPPPPPIEPSPPPIQLPAPTATREPRRVSPARAPQMTLTELGWPLLGVARNRSGHSRDLVCPVPSARRRRDRSGLPRSPEPGLDDWLHRARSQRIALGMRDRPSGRVRLLLGVGVYLRTSVRRQARARSLRHSPARTHAPHHHHPHHGRSRRHPHRGRLTLHLRRRGQALVPMGVRPSHPDKRRMPDCASRAVGRATPQSRRKRVRQRPLPARCRHRLTQSGWARRKR